TSFDHAWAIRASSARRSGTPISRAWPSSSVSSERRCARMLMTAYAESVAATRTEVVSVIRGPMCTGLRGSCHRAVCNRLDTRTYVQYFVRKVGDGTTCVLALTAHVNSSYTKNSE